MRRRSLPVIILTVVLSFVFAAVQQRQIAPTRIQVIEAIDGDTIRITGKRSLRYIGIDTPEVRERTSAGYQYRPQPFAIEATAFNKRLVEGKDIRIEYDVERTDRYKRLLGYVFVKDEQGNEIFVNEWLLREGLAVLFTFPPNVKYTQRFVKAQREARASGRGLWGTYVPITPEDAGEWVGRLACVRGRVRSCYNSGKAHFLSFGTAPKSLTVVIFKKDLFYFQQSEIEPCDYKGKTVEVIGKVKEYKGAPEIIVRDPSQIIVLDKVGQ